MAFRCNKGHKGVTGRKREHRLVALIVRYRYVQRGPSELTTRWAISARNYFEIVFLHQTTEHSRQIRKPDYKLQWAAGLEGLVARVRATYSWAAPVCNANLHMTESSMQWSLYDLDAHQLFPPVFRRGLMMALGRVGRGLPQHVPMLIAVILRSWPGTL